MSWIDDEFDSEGRKADRKEIIAANVATMYEELWKEILKVVKHPRIDTRFKLKTNGNPFHRRIWDWEGRTLNIDLGENQESVHATFGGEIIAQLEFEIDKSDVVYFSEGKNRLDYESAARAMMKPFLFPAQ